MSEAGAEFQHYNESLFSPSKPEYCQRLPLQRSHIVHQTFDPLNSSPICFSPDPNIFSQSTPEKCVVSQSPPSPADSGVVVIDSKFDAGNVSQESLPNLEQNKFQDDGDIFSTKTPLNFGPGSSSADENLRTQLECNTYNASRNLGLTSSNDADNSVVLPANLASIWSSPPSNGLEHSAPALEDDAPQAFAHWSANTPAPPPGLTSTAMLQKQLQQNAAVAQIQAMHQLSLQRSVNMTQANVYNRSTSHQAGLMSNLSARHPSSKPLFPPWNGSTSRSATLFNSLQHSAGSLRKSPFSSQVAAPRFHRSISTPAKLPYPSGQVSDLPMSVLQMSRPLSNCRLPTSLEENPFFKVPENRDRMMLPDNRDSIGFSSFESQLYDIMRSNDTFGAFSGNAAGKWPEMNSDCWWNDVTGSTLLGEYSRDRFSRKVFVGGLPPDIDEDEIQASFRQFGPLVVDWPHKAESKSYFPPKGYAFLLFQEEFSVQSLLSCCIRDGDKLYYRVSSPTIAEKPVQIRPWNLADSDFVLDGSQPLDPRKTVFVGGVPRPLRAVELAMIMDRYYGGVCYAGIDVDPDLKYPKGAGRVAFSNQQSYIAAISARFVQLQHGDIDKRVEVKPYVMDDQHCDECQGSRCGGKFAPFFCANVTCLQYYCEHCWGVIHARPGREFHKPLVKEGADRASRTCRW